MRKITKIALAGLGLAAVSTTAQAAPVGVQVGITAVMPPLCTFAEGQVNVALDNTNRTFMKDLTYTCNFASAGLNVYLSSANKGLVLQNDGGFPAKVRYNINFASTIAPDGNVWYPAENIDGTAQTGLIGQTAPGVPGTIKLGVFLRDGLKTAGLYNDTVSITVAP